MFLWTEPEVIAEVPVAGGYAAGFQAMVEVGDFDFATAAKSVYLEDKNSSAVYPGTVNGLEIWGFTAEFSGVPAGEYWLVAEVDDLFSVMDVFVDSYDEQPVVFGCQDRWQPAGEEYAEFRLRGSHLDALFGEGDSQPLVELLAGESVAAASTGDDWTWVKVSGDGRELHVGIKGAAGAIPAGDYPVRISSPALDPVYAARLAAMPLTFTDEPTLTGGVNPYILQQGDSGYTLRLDGFNLGALAGMDTVVVTLYCGDTALAPITAASTEAVVYDDGNTAGRGVIQARFDTALPDGDQFDGDLWYEVGVARIDHQAEVLSNGDLWVRVIDYTEFYGVEPWEMDPASYTWVDGEGFVYEQTLYGCNLNPDTDYEIFVQKWDDRMGDWVEYAAYFEHLEWDDPQGYRVQMTVANPLPGGSYRSFVFDGANRVGELWWQVRAAWPGFEVVLPPAEEIGYDATGLADFAIKLDVDPMAWGGFGIDNIDVSLHGNNGRRLDAEMPYDIVYMGDNPESLSLAVYAWFTDIPAGYYRAEAGIHGNRVWTEEFLIDSVESRPVLTEVRPTILPSGIWEARLHFDGINLQKLATATSIELKDGETTVAKAVSDPDAYFGWIWASDDGRNLDIGLKAVGDHIPAGDFTLAVYDTDEEWVEAIGNHLPDPQVHFTAGPVLDEGVNPYVLPSGDARTFALSMWGNHLTEIAGTDTVDISLWEDGASEPMCADIPGTITLKGDPELGQGELTFALDGTQLPGYETWLLIKVTDGAGADIPIGARTGIEITERAKVYGVAPRQSPLGSVTYDLELKGWNLAVGEEYIVTLYGAGEDPVVQSIIADSPESLPVTVAGPLPEGGYRFTVEEEVDDRTEWVGDAWWDIARPEIWITPPAAAVANTPFDLVIQVNNVDWSQIDLEEDINIRLHDRFGVSHICEVTGPEDGVLTATFAVPVGYYDAQVKVGEAEQWWHGIYVDSVDGAPALVKLEPQLRPAGEMHSDFRIRGYHLGQIAEGLTINLKNGSDILATNAGDGAWYNVNVSDQDSDTLDFCLRSKSDDGIPAGEGYTLEVLKDGVPLPSQVADTVKYTDQPMLYGGFRPEVLPAGIADFQLNLDGAWLGKLADSVITVRLYDGSDAVVAETSDVLTFLNDPEDPVGRGILAAYFAGQPLPSAEQMGEDGWGWLRMEVTQTKDEITTPIPGSPAGIRFTRNETIFGSSSEDYDLGQEFYFVELQGCNLDPDTPGKYSIQLVDDQDNVVDITAKVAGVYPGSLLVKFTNPEPQLPEGGYRVRVKSGTSEIGEGWWNIRDIRTEFQITLTPDTIVETEHSGEDNPYYADFTAHVSTWFADWSDIDPETDISAVLKGTQEQHFEGVISEVNPDYGTFEVSFTGVNAGEYDLIVWVGADGWVHEPRVIVDSYGSNPVFVDFDPAVMPAGMKDFSLRLEGYHFDRLSGSAYAELLSGTEVIATTSGNPEGVRVDPVDQNAGSWPLGNAKISFTASNLETGIPSGEYKLVVHDPGYEDQSNDQVLIRHLPPVKFTAGPVFDGGVTPWALPYGNGENDENVFGLQMHGANLDKLSGTVEVELFHRRSNGERIHYATASVDTGSDVQIEDANGGWGWMAFEVNGRDLPQSDIGYEPWLEIEVTDDNGIVPFGNVTGVQITGHSVICEADPRSGYAGIGPYAVTLKGWNLDSTKTYTVAMEGPEGLVEMSAAAVSERAWDSFLYTFTPAQPLVRGNYRFVVSEGEEYLGDAWWWLDTAWLDSRILLVEGYTGETVTLTEPEGQNLWPDGASLTVEFYKRPDEPGKNDPLVVLDALTANGDTLVVPVPENFDSGEYVLRVLYQGKEVALSGFPVRPEITVSPAMVTELPASLTFTTNATDTPYVVIRMGGSEYRTSGFASRIGATDDYEFVFGGTGIVDGEYSFIVFDGDPEVSGQPPVAVGQFTVEAGIAPDETAPVIDIVYPESGEVVTSGEIEVAFSITDEDGGSGVNPDSVINRLHLGDVLITEEFEFINGTTYVYFPPEALAEGVYTVEVEAFDLAGNQASLTWSFTVDFPPEVPTATSIEISGPTHLTLPASGNAAAAYSAVVFDQDDMVMADEAVTWSLVSPVEGVTVDPTTGAVTATSTAVGNAFVLQAQAVSDASVRAELTVQLVRIAADSIIPVLAFDKPAYAPGNIVTLALKLTNVPEGARTNSATFEIIYDDETFELATGDAETSIISGVLPLTVKGDVAAGEGRKLVATYIDQSGEATLADGSTLFTVHLRVKAEATSGPKVFQLEPAEMSDQSFNSYLVNGGYLSPAEPLPTYHTTNIVEGSLVEGYISLYLGDPGTLFASNRLAAMQQDALNAALAELRLTLKRDTADAGLVYTGAEIFVADEAGNLGVSNGTMVIAQVSLPVTDIERTQMVISGGGYLAETLTLSFGSEGSALFSAAEAPLVLYPGDLGRVVIGGQSVSLVPDGRINNIDFSAWLWVYRASLRGDASDGEFRHMDLTRDNRITNLDFTLWLMSYRNNL